MFALTLIVSCRPLPPSFPFFLTFRLQVATHRHVEFNLTANHIGRAAIAEETPGERVVFLLVLSLNASNGSQTTQKCSKKDCKRTVPNGRPRLCDKCREQQRIYKQRSRAKEKNKENLSVSHKRPSPDENESHSDLKRPRASVADDIGADGHESTPWDADDSCENSSAYTLYDTAEDFYKDLKSLAKSSTKLDIKGRYFLNDDDDVPHAERVLVGCGPSLRAANILGHKSWQFGSRSFG
ncbi:hypothetical protein NMY22_g10149 [Coprinellus aureogranulatus]|nr:hypothetical protein NMY22_g10149 [Coprinellus aureogranulatus]